MLPGNSKKIPFHKRINGTFGSASDSIDVYTFGVAAFRRSERVNFTRFIIPLDLSSMENQRPDDVRCGRVGQRDETAFETASYDV